MKYLLILMLFFTGIAHAIDPTVKITAPVQTLVPGQTTTVTFTWSESVTGFTAASVFVLGDGTLSGFSGSGTTYTANFQKLADRDSVALYIDNNATTPPGNSATLGFNVSPKVYIKEFNTFLGRPLEAVPQPRCPLPGEFLADAGGSPTTPIAEEYFIYKSTTRNVLALEQVRSTCLTRLIGGLQYLKKIAPPNYELINVHGAHNHSKLMPKITQQQVATLVGTSKTRVRPSNLATCSPDGTGKYLCKAAGDFRASNFAGKLATDDPIVFPGVKGAAHLHVFYGNISANYQTNSASLVKNCVSLFAGGCANATGYWAPDIVDTATNTAIIPDGILIYYKAGDTYPYMKYTEPLPQGLKIIAGNPAATTAAQQTDTIEITCFGRDGSTVLTQIIPACKGDTNNLLRIVVRFPQCVADDGTGKIQLDSVDHRSHLSPAGYSGAVGVNGCPAAFPHRIAAITQLIDYHIMPNQNTKTWRLSSDNYSASLPGGASAHADWWGGWKVYWANRLNEQCNKVMINCGVDYIGLNDGVAINNITTVGNIATLTTVLPHLLSISNPDGSYPTSVGAGAPAALQGRLTGVTGASAATYNFDPTKVTNTDAAYPDPAGTIIPLGNEPMKIIDATHIQLTLPSTPATLINGAVDPAVVKLQWGENLCGIEENCGLQSYSDFYYGSKQ